MCTKNKKGVLMKVLKTIRIDEKILKQLTILSKKDNRTLNNLIETVLVEFIKNNDGDLNL